MRLPDSPAVYEINTAVWLSRLGRGITLGEVPDAEWDTLAALAIDAVWLMGVWQRSRTGRLIALADPEIDAGNRATLADLRAEDVIGSPYCVQRYVAGGRFGGPEGLEAARAQLAKRDIGLILDYVPNHVAIDHPWVAEHPEYFVAGSEEDLAREPRAFALTGGRVYANGRDPYFPAWTDVLQLNAFSPGLREAAAHTVLEIAQQCDGVRCDMAMLLTNAVFARTWGERVGVAPAEEFWPQLIAAVKSAHPGFLFMAEVYWDMESELQQQGFDLCYDKRLYDRLVEGDASAVAAHLRAGIDYQNHLIRFIENHDEPRAAAVFGAARERAAAVVTSTLPGARLYHDGQLEGRRIQVPIQLRRGPGEPVDTELRAFYERLLRAVADAGLRGGEWRLCSCSGWPDNDSYRNLVAWCWDGAGESREVVAVNLSGVAAEGWVRLPWDDLGGLSWTLTDRLSGAPFEHDGDALAADGLYVGLEPWGSHFLAFGDT